jgi:hypothetical protein
MFKLFIILLYIQHITQNLKLWKKLFLSLALVGLLFSSFDDRQEIEKNNETNVMSDFYLYTDSDTDEFARQSLKVSLPLDGKLKPFT